MEKRKHINLLIQQPKTIGKMGSKDLQAWIQQYPYFQSLQCVYLKKLYIQDSFQYNMQLKRTAALTSQRAILFDFITSEEFDQQEIARQIQQLQQQEEYDETQEFGITTSEAEAISQPDLFIPKTKTGKPLEFSAGETHSFQQWLQLTHVNPINRSKNEGENKLKVQKQAEKASSNPKMDKIDSFLKNNPKIKPTKNYVSKKELKLKTSPSTQLMTETLARVYEEQKAYEKAIQAYKILILNNPEKNSFFATQIERLEQLLENNT